MWWLKQWMLFFCALLMLVSVPVAAHARRSQRGASASSKKSKSKKSKKSKRKRRKKKSAKKTIYYRVKKGDTIGGISRRYHVSIASILRWNHLKDKHTIRHGQRLKLRVLAKDARGSGGDSRSRKGGDHKQIRQKKYYIVKRGDTLGKIARRHKVSKRDLKKWNRAVRKHPNRLRKGQRIVVGYTRIDATGSSSYGAANHGKLIGGVLLPPGPGYIVRNKSHSYGTPLMVDNIMKAMASYARHFKNPARFLIGDLSRKHGGRFRPHVSHQSGRDVDIALMPLPNKELKHFQKLTPKTMDIPKNWYLIERLLESKEVQYIFLDYKLQKPLYEYALKKGYNKAQLQGIIQYPGGKKSYRAIIRHARGHANHIHVRFVCPKNDKHCR